MAASPARLRGFGARFAELSTGIKIFAILTAAVLPLGIIALLAALQTNRTADNQRRADLRVATSEAARRLGFGLAADLSLARGATEAAVTAEGAKNACLRLDMTLAGRRGTRPAYALFGPDRTIACGTPGFAPLPPAAQLVLAAPRVTIENDTLTIAFVEPNGRGAAVIRYPAAALANLVKPIGLPGPASLVVSSDGRELTLQRNDLPYMTQRDTATAPAGVLGLDVAIAIARAPFSAAEALQAFLPLLMWASAAIVAFLITDRLLIRPLYRLRNAIAQLKPGERYVAPEIATPALEIRDLAATFERATATIAAHEESIARALSDQVKLTREVHHRVKNNLQVVASLINLHARGAPAGPVADAYASIQRRVDALAIVHRNHYAELEDNHGVSVKALLGELAANLRTGLAATGTAPPITTAAIAARVTQDVAVPIAFLVTELTELSISRVRDATIAISLSALNQTHARLSIVSRPLAEIGASEAGPEPRYSRVLGGLARQLRGSLEADAALGGYRIDVPIIGA